MTIKIPWDDILRTSYYTINKKRAEEVVAAFIAHIPDRIRALSAWMREGGDTEWVPDYSDESLCRIGKQVKRRIGTHRSEPGEVEINPQLPDFIKDAVRESIVASWQELSSKDKCVAVDIGIYLAECVRTRASFGEWTRCPANRGVSYNYPMLGLTKNCGINPFVTGQNIVMAIVDGTEQCTGIADVCDVLVSQAQVVQKKQTGT